MPPTAEPCVAEDSDVSWVLISTVLVLGMMPGLGFFEAGLLRSKNTTSIMIQIFSGASVLSVLWVLFGYSITLGSNTNGGFIGNFNRALFVGMGYSDCYGSTVIPEALYALFQMMFAMITPLLMTGAYAERLAYRPFIIFTVCWEILVYYPVAHWIWGPGGWLNNMGAQDFAGGIVIHTTAGVSSLVACMMLGRRNDFDAHHGEAPYSSLPLASIGASMLWTGWFGFNGGSALQAGRGAVHAVMNSQVAAATCATIFVMYHMFRTGKASLLQCINGAIAGLAGITPASGYITVPSAIVLAIILAVCAQISIFILKHKLKIDDALDVSSVHGVPGLVGALFIGFCGDASVAGANGIVMGGSGKLLGVQLLACLVTAVWSAVWTFLIFRGVSLFYHLRVDDHGERVGLDAAQHNEPTSQHHEHTAAHHEGIMGVIHSALGHISHHHPAPKAEGTYGATGTAHHATTRASSSSNTRSSVVIRRGAALRASMAVQVNNQSIVVLDEHESESVGVDDDPRVSVHESVYVNNDGEDEIQETLISRP